MISVWVKVCPSISSLMISLMNFLCSCQNESENSENRIKTKREEPDYTKVLKIPLPEIVMTLDEVIQNGFPVFKWAWLPYLPHQSIKSTKIETSDTNRL